MPESWFLHRLFHRSGRCSFLVADRNWGDEVDRQNPSQLLQGKLCYYVSRYCEASKLLGMAYDACHFCRE
ncbi:hypothetical protein MCOR29_003210 [Pyricularia oryzae]|uniref:Uncharacterized protein n=1 Tax=Pyricularia grisea TaxID=148305 RepID=A0ABQ8NKJ2_PYRGI|nr:hypothetical protein MCOR19_006051 [Pyricularia oryzae]KAI6298436.1 hypothetical protein MCOR33_005422 [Pyricularia grisea]KAI6327065.1 hypothetical protein MCOR29_003210 [Pyricularia oryzae]KAI6394553.1 hypothetical protein MCOR24_009517 [Pyricularia oryzae]KAI6426563.1 hypothetical protein MCOR21_006618 [Pyricularia oryzae]